MAKLTYSALMSLDGYIEDIHGQFDWAMPDDDVHRFINDLERTNGTYLFGRRMYETMAVWETDPGLAAGAPLLQDFAQIWRAADKVVFSKTLAAVSTARTRLERDFTPEIVRHLKATCDHDIAIGGPDLASQAFAAGLIDECQLFLMPVVVGGGKPALPTSNHLALELLEESRFGNGAVYLRYRMKR